jgi:signal transduction histidine kinase
MPNKVSAVLSKHPLHYAVAYLTLAVVALVELLLIPASGTQGATAGLLLIFGGLLAVSPFFKTFNWQSHLYLALQTGVVASLLLLRPGSLMAPLLFCVLSAMAPMSVTSRSAALWIVLFAVINVVHFSAVKKIEHGWMIALPFTVGYIFCGTFASSLVRTNAARRRSEALLAELQGTHERLQAYAARVEELVISQERNRLAREMHDTLGHRLTVAAVQLEGAERLIPTHPGRAAGMVKTVHEEVVEALAELRRTVATLRTPLEVDLSLPVALTRLAQGFEKATGIKTNQSLPESLPPLSEAQRLALYRAAQEALTNVQRHAQAQQVWLELALENGMISLLVKDNGRGFEPEGRRDGFGLRGLRERAAHLKGECHLESSSGQGAQICFHLPLQETSEAPPEPTPALLCGWKLRCPLSQRRTGSEAPSKLSEALEAP